MKKVKITNIPNGNASKILGLSSNNNLVYDQNHLKRVILTLDKNKIYKIFEHIHTRDGFREYSIIITASPGASYSQDTYICNLSTSSTTNYFNDFKLLASSRPSTPYTAEIYHKTDAGKFSIYVSNATNVSIVFLSGQNNIIQEVVEDIPDGAIKV